MRERSVPVHRRCPRREMSPGKGCGNGPHGAPLHPGTVPRGGVVEGVPARAVPFEAILMSILLEERRAAREMSARLATLAERVEDLSRQLDLSRLLAGTDEPE